MYHCGYLRASYNLFSGPVDAPMAITIHRGDESFFCIRSFGVKRIAAMK